MVVSPTTKYYSTHHINIDDKLAPTVRLEVWERERYNENSDKIALKASMPCNSIINEPHKTYLHEHFHNMEHYNKRNAATLPLSQTQGLDYMLVCANSHFLTTAQASIYVLSCSVY